MIVDVAKVSRDTTLFEWTAQNVVDPMVVERAKGVYFWDRDNKEYLDFNSQTMCVNIGHGNDRVASAIIKQLEKVAFVSGHNMTTSARAELGTLLQEITPGNLCKAYFTTSGTEANEHAIKMARAFTKREKVIARYRSYHGSTAGSLSLTGDPRRWSAGSGLPGGVVHVMDAFPEACRWCKCAGKCTLDCLNHIEDVIRFEGSKNIAAIIIEPIVGTNGIIIPPNGYMEGLRELTKRHNILLIADEIMSGFGRTGKWFGVNHWDVVPDIMTVAKGLTSAYVPLGAAIVNDEIAEFFECNALYSGSTYNAHPIACAAAVACIEVYKDNNLIENAAVLGEVMKNSFKDLKSKHKCIGSTRAIGLFGVIELIKNNGEPLVPFNASIDEQTPMLELKKYLLEQGLYVFTRWNNIFVIPPLCINQEELLHGIDIIDNSLFIMSQMFNK